MRNVNIIQFIFTYGVFLTFFLTGEDRSPTNPLRLRVERYLAIKNSQNQPEPAPIQAPTEASMGPPAQGQCGPISISNLLNPAPNLAPNPAPNVKGKSKASEKGRKSM